MWSEYAIKEWTNVPARLNFFHIGFTGEYCSESRAYLWNKEIIDQWMRKRIRFRIDKFFIDLLINSEKSRSVLINVKQLVDGNEVF